MTEKLEQFNCPGCGSPNYIIWSEIETERTIPCLVCYGEEFSQNESGETILVTRGKKIFCIKNSGVREFFRDSNTFIECEE